MNWKSRWISPMICLSLVLALGCAAIADDAPEEAPAEPERPGITRTEPGTNIREIHSDPFELGEAVIEGDVLKITVSYSGGAAEHDFTLYWSGISTRSLPPQLPMSLKHNANGDAAEAMITETIELDLTSLNKPCVLNIHTDHGGRATVRYGEGR